MTRILTFTSNPTDWQALLSQPQKHWRKGYSARTLAHCWEAADGFPPEIAAVLGACDHPTLDTAVPLLALPEFRVPLPGGDRPSQNDIFVLAKSNKGPVTLMIEGKVDEPFGPTIGEWQTGQSAGKVSRLDFLLRTLGLAGPLPPTIRYQLLHRAASALLTGGQYRAVAGVLLVHSFSVARAGWADYEAFLGLFGVTANAEELQLLQPRGAIPLFAAWVTGNRGFLSR